MKRLHYLLIIILFFPVAGCKKFLAEEPLKQVTITTVAQLEALVDNATAFANQNNSTAGYSTDDTEIPSDLYKTNPGTFTADYMKYYVFNVNDIVNIAADQLWNAEYKKIYTVNLVLTNIDKVTGDDVARERLRADAHFIRAYSYWLLANYYCAPYSEGNLGTLGLPLKKTTDYSESMKRATLKETYDFILSDLQEAQKVVNVDVDPLRRWRVSQNTISAFLSRYYLFIGNYDQSLAEANKALATTGAKLVDFNTLKAGVSKVYANPAVTITYSELNDWGASKYLYWSEFYYCRLSLIGTQWLIPSPSLLALYDRDRDLRFKYFMTPNGNRRFNVLTPATYRYTVFGDGLVIPDGPTVAEVLLNKAEALARKGDFNGAMLAVNTLRAKRMTTIVDLIAANQNDAILRVLEERRREMPFAKRWFDIRRFSVNNFPGDDITVTRNFFKVSASGVDVNTPQTYTLEAKRYLVPINGVEMDASRGQIIQNPY